MPASELNRTLKVWSRLESGLSTGALDFASEGKRPFAYSEEIWPGFTVV